MSINRTEVPLSERELRHLYGLRVNRQGGESKTRDHRIKARLAGEKALRELNQPIHTEYNKRKPQQPKRRANLRRFANRVYPGQFAGAFESADCSRKTLHGYQSPRRSHYHPSSRINQRGQRNQHKVNHLLPYRQIRRDFPTVLPPSPQEILEKRVILVRHGYPEWLGYSILSVYRYWESALERDSSDPDEQFLGYRMSGSNSPETTSLSRPAALFDFLGTINRIPEEEH